MTSNVIVFHTDTDLMALTGINDRMKLWDAGFNLDDWDFGVCLDHCITRSYDHTWTSWDGEKYTETEYEEAEGNSYWENRLVQDWQSYCVGGSYTEYNGKHYYLWHHS